ncbi:MAG: DUF2807 domain-containing protein [Desulfuromonas sp.]|nr:DUF2807 domain-containing protein [Desulfuromonas sp.]
MHQMISKKNCLFTLGIIFLFSSFSFAWQQTSNCIEGNGKTAETERSLQSFSAVALHGSYSVSVIAGTKMKCTLRGDSNLLKHVITKVADKKLTVDNDASLCMKQSLEIELQVPSLEFMSAEGVHEITIKNLHESDFALIVNGANIVEADGEITNLKVDISGTSTLDARRLFAQNVDVTAAGTTSAMVQVQKELKVTASGIAEVLYSGQPKSINSNLSGLAAISELD